MSRLHSRFTVHMFRSLSRLLNIATYTRRVSSPRSYFPYFPFPLSPPRLCRIMPRLLVAGSRYFAPGSSLLHLFGPRPTLRGRAAGEGALAERGRRVWSGGVGWKWEAAGEEVGVPPEAESTPSSLRRMGCWCGGDGGSGGGRRG